MSGRSTSAKRLRLGIKLACEFGRGYPQGKPSVEYRGEAGKLRSLPRGLGTETKMTRRAKSDR